MGCLSCFIVPIESGEMPTRQSLRVGKGVVGITESFVGNTEAHSGKHGSVNDTGTNSGHGETLP